MKYLIFSFIFLMIFSSCESKRNADVFPATVNIKHRRIFNDDELALNMGKMFYFNADSSIVIRNFSDDHHLVKINLHDNKTSMLLPYGQGPDEFAQIKLSQKTSDSTFLFQDINKTQLYEMNILSGQITKYFSPENSRCLDIVKMNNGFIATGVFDDGMFAVWDNDVFVNYMNKYPEDDYDDDKMAAKALAYQGKLLVNEHLNRFIFCSTLFSYFELFQFDTKELKSIKKSYWGEYKYHIDIEHGTSAHPYENNREGYVDACVTNNKIYLLYSGRSIEDIDVATHEEAGLSNQILVYDWDGNPIVKYETDVDLASICVNTSGNIIYGISHNPDPDVVFFEIP